MGIAEYVRGATFLARAAGPPTPVTNKPGGTMPRRGARLADDSGLPVAVPIDRHGALHTADLGGEFVVHLVFDIDSDIRTLMARQ